MALEKIRSPEERELDRKRTELAALERDLVERELDLATLQQKLTAFEVEYRRWCVGRYAALDDLAARIAEERAQRCPNDDAVRHDARRAREAADATAAQAGHETSSESPAVEPVSQEPAPSFDPPSSLKDLYRSAAKKLHPDLASTDDDRARRTEWMAKVNDAYQKQDEDALKALLTDWEASPESVSGEGTASDLVRAIRQIELVQGRIDSIGRTIGDLEDTDLHRLYVQYENHLESGRNLLEDIAADIDRRIADARRELADLQADPE